MDVLAVGCRDPDGELGAVFGAKELLRDVFSAADEAHVRRRMIAFYAFCADADIPELTRLAPTIRRWSELIFNYHRTGRAFYGGVENVHMLIERPAAKPTDSPTSTTMPANIRTPRHQMAYSTRPQDTALPTTVHCEARFSPSVGPFEASMV